MRRFHPDDARGRQKIGTGQRRCNDRRSATPYPYRCPRWAATPCPRRRPRLPAPAPPSPCSWTTAPRRRRESAKGPRRSRCRRRNTPGRILRAALGGDPTRGPRDDHGCGFLMRRATPLASFALPCDGPMPTCSYAGSVFLRRAMPPSALPMGAATPYPYRCPRWAATPCPRRRSRLPAPAPPSNSPCSWTTAPRSGPGPLALSPPKLLRPGALRALVFRRPRSRRTRPARGQQPHADGAGPLRARAARAVAAETPSAWRIARALDSAVAPHEDLVTTTISFVRRGAFLLTFSSSESRCR